MLDNHEISVGCLATYVGFLVGLGLITLSQILGMDEVSRWGFAALLLTCTYSIHRSVVARTALLTAAFELGRQHERDIVPVRSMTGV